MLETKAPHLRAQAGTSQAKADKAIVDQILEVDRLKGAKKQKDLAVSAHETPGGKMSTAKGLLEDKQEALATKRGELRSLKPHPSTIDLKQSLPPFLRLASEPIEKLANRIADLGGRGIEAVGNLKIPAKWKPAIGGIKKLYDKGDKKAAQATVALYLRSDPDFQRWLSGVLE